MTSINDKRKGFASISPQRRKEIARLGGIRAHQLGLAHTFTSEEARQAGRKGGALGRRGPVKPKETEEGA